MPESLTKGDLDIQIRVAASDFQRVSDVLAERFARNAGGFTSECSVSYKGDNADPPLGLHVTVYECADDIQWRLRDVLISRPDLRVEYDDLKKRFEGKSVAEYRAAKKAFFERLKSLPEYLATFDAT